MPTGPFLKFLERSKRPERAGQDSGTELATYETVEKSEAGCTRWCGSVAQTEGGSRAPRTMPADPRSGKLVCGSALLVYQCAFGDWFAIARGAHDPPAACRLRQRDGLFNSLLSGTPDGARLMLLCLP